MLASKELSILLAEVLACEEQLRDTLLKIKQIRQILEKQIPNSAMDEIDQIAQNQWEATE